MTQFQTQKMISPEEKVIKYLTIRGYDQDSFPSFSFDPTNSDQVDNQTILNTLVMTLVKFGVSGKIEPYLASSWNVSSDSKRWQFFVKDGFTCESGLKITAEFVKKSLLENFKRNLEKTDKSEFSLIRGWKIFFETDGAELLGLTTLDNSVIFEFENSPSGILNYLRMPYFGIWCPENFSNGVFKNNSNFSSSGPYKVDKIISTSRLLLSMRTDQPNYNLNSPQKIEIGYGTIDELKKSIVPTIGKVIVENDIGDLEKFENIDAPPLIFQGIVLHTSSKFFSNLTNRKVFAKRLIEFQEKNMSANFSEGFYLTSKLDKSLVQKWPNKFDKINYKLKIALQYLPSTLEVQKLWENLFSYVFDGLSYEIIYPKQQDPNWIKSILNNSDYDLRTASVNAGATHIVSAIKMMFCTRLGICFPDPSSKISQLVEDYTKNDKDADKFFEETFNKIIIEDSAVFPLFHAKERWLISKDIDINSMPATIVHPLFEKIRVK